MRHAQGTISTRSPVVAVPKRSGNALAIFDLDRTLYPGSSLVPLAAALHQQGLVRRASMVHAVVRNVLFRHRGASDTIAERVCQQVLGNVAGMPVAHFDQAVDGAADRVVADARPAILSALEYHRLAGSFCVLLSASPQELVTAVADRLGMHRAVGSVAEVVDGSFTGRLAEEFCYGPGKLTRLEQALGVVDLSTAWACTGLTVRSAPARAVWDTGRSGAIPPPATGCPRTRVDGGRHTLRDIGSDAAHGVVDVLHRPYQMELPGGEGSDSRRLH